MLSLHFRFRVEWFTRTLCVVVCFFLSFFFIIIILPVALVTLFMWDGWNDQQVFTATCIGWRSCSTRRTQPSSKWPSPIKLNWVSDVYCHVFWFVWHDVIITLDVFVCIAMTHLDKIKLYGKQLRTMPSKHQGVQMPKEGQPDAGLTKDFVNSSLHRFKKPGSKNYQNIYPPSSTLHLSNIP